MNRFENVDVLAALEQLMRQNTAFYRNDFEIDKEIIRQAAASDKAKDKTLLWMSRPSGTYCFRERDVFLQDTRQHNTWRFYGEQTRDRILACPCPASPRTSRFPCTAGHWFAGYRRSCAGWKHICGSSPYPRRKK